MFCFFETGSHNVTEANLKLEILLPRPPMCGIRGVHHLTLLMKSVTFEVGLLKNIHKKLNLPFHVVPIWGINQVLKNKR
jgi:hypothetical protein